MELEIVDLKAICKAHAHMRDLGFAYDHIDQVMAKILEELEEIKEAMRSNDREHLKEEVGDLIQATLALSDFLGIDGDKALASAYAKLQIRYEKYMQAIKDRSIDLQAIKFEEKLQLWQEIKNA